VNGDLVWSVSVWVIPVVLAITLHEASHGYVAHLFGDDTAWNAGRVSANPLRHIDPFGTILLPGMLLLAHSPFLFGYAKPVPINFWALRNPKRDMIWVAAAGPVTNILMALAAGFMTHLLPFLPVTSARWFAENLLHAIEINVILAVFNMIPLPPLDGGRVAVGLLPRTLALPLARLERYGILVLLALLILVPLVGQQFGYDLNPVADIIEGPADFMLDLIGSVTGVH
jgi:Zn-dependent protease